MGAQALMSGFLLTAFQRLTSYAGDKIAPHYGAIILTRICKQEEMLAIRQASLSEITPQCEKYLIFPDPE